MNVNEMEDDIIRERIRNLLQEQIMAEQMYGSGDLLGGRKRKYFKKLSRLSQLRLKKAQRKVVPKMQMKIPYKEIVSHNPWIKHVNDFRRMNPHFSYKQALQHASSTYRTGSGYGTKSGAKCNKYIKYLKSHHTIKGYKKLGGEDGGYGGYGTIKGATNNPYIEYLRKHGTKCGYKKERKRL